MIAARRAHLPRLRRPHTDRPVQPTQVAAGGARPRGALHGLSAAAQRHWLLLLGMASFTGLLAAVTPQALVRAFAGVRVLPLVLMVPVVLASYAARGLGFRVALRRIGVRIGSLRSVAVMIAGQALVFLPAGDLGRVALVVETGADNRAAGEVAGAIAFQELLYMSVVGLAVIPIIALHPAYVGAFATLAALDAAIIVTLLSDTVFARVLGLAAHMPLVRRLEPDIRGLRNAFVACVNGRTAAGVAAFSGLAAALGFLLFVLSLRAVGADGVSLADAAFIYAVGHLLSAVSMLPGGLGAYEGVLTGFLALHGVAVWQGAGAALLYRAANDVLMAMAGIAVGGVLRLRAAPRTRRPVLREAQA